MPAGDGTRQPLGRRIVSAMTERLALKGAALFFACVLWLVVSAEEPTEQVVEVAVVPRLDSTMALVGRRPVVRALVIGRARDLLELAGDPPIARPAVASTTRDSVLVTIGPSDIELEPETRVIVREVRPRSLVLHVARVSRPSPPATAAESVLAGLIRLPAGAIDTDRLPDTPVPDSAFVDEGAAARDSARADSVRADSVRGDSLRRAVARAMGVRREAARRDSVRRDSVRRDSVRRDSLRRDSVRRGDARPDAPPPE